MGDPGQPGVSRFLLEELLVENTCDTDMLSDCDGPIFHLEQTKVRLHLEPLTNWLRRRNTGRMSCNGCFFRLQCWWSELQR